MIPNVALFAIFIASGILVASLDKAKSGLAMRISPRQQLSPVHNSKAQVKPIYVLLEMPDFVALIGFAVAAGESLESGIRIAVLRSSGLLSQEFGQVISRVDSGSVLQFELESLVNTAENENLRELAIKLALANSNGSAVAEMLNDFSQSCVLELKATLLDRAGKAETKMMIPLVFVILPITVVFAIYPSLNLLQASFL